MVRTDKICSANNLALIIFVCFALQAYSNFESIANASFARIRLVERLNRLKRLPVRNGQVAHGETKLNDLPDFLGIRPFLPGYPMVISRNDEFLVSSTQKHGRNEEATLCVFTDSAVERWKRNAFEFFSQMTECPRNGSTNI